MPSNINLLKTEQKVQSLANSFKMGGRHSFNFLNDEELQKVVVTSIFETPYIFCLAKQDQMNLDL